MEQQENSNGSETKVYERALEISRNRLTELTWNNILYEANLDVMKIEAEEDKVSEEVVQLQLHIQELLKQNEEISNQKNDFENKYTQMDVDYTRLQELYTELLQRSELKEEEYKLELEKLKPTPKKKGRPKKEIVQDGGLLGSA